ncbi:hypothetical protein B0O99DRAFT_600385 [Bisporella sp. PMI_857]|nr:hypothetical protein B0O99DRAFT_600385 [Bisporella sp. PMI_857]
MPFVIDDIIGLVGLALAVPGLLKTKKKIQDFIISLEHGTMRRAPETVEDLCVDTSDEGLRKDLQASAQTLWTCMKDLDQQICKLKSAVDCQNKTRAAKEKAVAVIQNMRDLEFQLWQQVQAQVASNSLRSRFELRDNQFCLIRASTRLKFSSARVMNALELQDQRFRFFFALLKDRVKPNLLRDIFTDLANTPVPLIPRNFRLFLPRKLAEVIYHVHEQQLVHKCLRLESILLFPGDCPELERPKVIRAPILADWQYARELAQVSKRKAYDDWALEMYQHPERWALPDEAAESKYNTGHDIYSLGVCLLEIGLWDSFIIESKLEENGPIIQTMTEPLIEQKVYITLAGDRLAYEMGEAYSKLVIRCLTCIKKGFGNVLMFVERESSNWYEQGVLFIQEIRKSLADASTMGIGVYNTIP